MTASQGYVKSLVTPALSLDLYLYKNKILRTRLRKDSSAFLLPAFSPYFFRRGDADLSSFSLDWDSLHPSCRRVYELLLELAPFGKTITYGELASRAGVSPRFVGFCMKRNPFPLLIPCHRVVARRGIGGFSPGVELKKELLKHEGAFQESL